MTAPTFAAARARGTAGKIGQLNPLSRGGVAEGEQEPTKHYFLGVSHICSIQKLPKWLCSLLRVGRCSDVLCQELMLHA